MDHLTGAAVCAQRTSAGSDRRDGPLAAVLRRMALAIPQRPNVRSIAAGQN